MPKTKRDLMKRQVGHVYNNLNLAGGHLQQLIDEFQPVHPELAEVLEAMQGGILVQLEMLNKFVFACWGVIDPPWDSWRNVPEREGKEGEE